MYDILSKKNFNRPYLTSVNNDRTFCLRLSCKQPLPRIRQQNDWRYKVTERISACNLSCISRRKYAKNCKERELQKEHHGSYFLCRHAFIGLTMEFFSTFFAIQPSKVSSFLLFCPTWRADIHIFLGISLLFLGFLREVSSLLGLHIFHAVFSRFNTSTDNFFSHWKAAEIWFRYKKGRDRDIRKSGKRVKVRTQRRDQEISLQA